LKEFWHFGQYVSEIQNTLEYPENVTVNELPKFNAVKEAYQMLEKLVYMF
jgi:hypothetical protein